MPHRVCAKAKRSAIAASTAGSLFGQVLTWFFLSNFPVCGRAVSANEITKPAPDQNTEGSVPSILSEGSPYIRLRRFRPTIRPKLQRFVFEPSDGCTCRSGKPFEALLGVGLSTIINVVAYWPGCCRTVILPSCVAMRLWVTPVDLLPAFLIVATNTAIRITNKPKTASLRFILT